MVKRLKKHRLKVTYNDRLVGHLAQEAQGFLTFKYDDQWLNTTGARPLSLSMPLREQSYQGDLVYHFFDNLLPDNPQVRARIQAEFQTPTDRPFDLLTAIGHDCVGAIQIANTVSTQNKQAMEFNTLSENDISALLKHTKTHPLGMINKNDDFRISIAGAQEKTALLYWQDQWCLPLNQTPTTHIFKLPIGYIAHHQIDLSNSTENEWLCAQLAKGFGLSTAPCEIKTFEENKVLIVERFDRKLSQDQTHILRLPQEDMCQALGISPNLKYQSDGGPSIQAIMQLLLGSTDAQTDRRHFFKTQILFYLLAAIDGHAKNFSLHLKPYGEYQLTPLYDIISAHPLIQQGSLSSQKIKMAMALKGKNTQYHWSKWQKRHFISTATWAHYDCIEANRSLEEMMDTAQSVIDSVAKALPTHFPEAMADAIFSGILKAKEKLK